MNGLWTVLRKECVDNLRDRRTIISTLGVALGAPVLFIGLMGFVISNALGEADQASTVAVVGAEHAPGLMAHFTRHNVEVAAIDSEDPRAEVTEGRHPLVLVVAADYGERFRRGAPSTVLLIHDSSEFGAAGRNYRRVSQLIDGYARRIGVLRLQLRGVSPALLRPVAVQEVDTATPADRALTVLSTLPYFLVLVIFMGGFYLAIDATAGEREHGSLEPLLIQPVTRTALVLGKVLAAGVFSLLALVLFLTSMSLSLPLVPLDRIGMSLSLTLPTAVAIVAVALPLVLFGAALLTVVACFARSYKEAQTYLTLVVLVPTLPLILVRLLNIETSTALMAVPSLSQATLIDDLIAGAAISPVHVLLSYAVTGALAAALIWLAVVLYRRERILI